MKKEKLMSVFLAVMLILAVRYQETQAHSVGLQVTSGDSRMLVDLTHTSSIDPYGLGDFGHSNLFANLTSTGYSVNYLQYPEITSTLEHIDRYVSSSFSTTFDVTFGAVCLIVNLESQNEGLSFRLEPPSSQGIFGSYFWAGKSYHVHNPESGTWNFTIWASEPKQVTLVVGTGPDPLNLQLLSGYDILILAPGPYSGLGPSAISNSEENAIEQFVANGGSLLWLDKPYKTLILKPIIRITSEAIASLNISVDMRGTPILVEPNGRTTFKEPDRCMISWNSLQISPTSPKELWYEAANMGSNNDLLVHVYENGSAVVQNTGRRDLQCIYVIGFNGSEYFFARTDSLESNCVQALSLEMTDRSTMVGFLEKDLISDSMSAGLTKDEATDFFERWGWVRLWLHDLEAKSPSAMILHRMSKSDADSLIPMRVAGVENASISRVLWERVCNMPFARNIHGLKQDVSIQGLSETDQEYSTSPICIHEYGVIDVPYESRSEESYSVENAVSAGGNYRVEKTQALSASYSLAQTFGIQFYNEGVSDPTDYYLYQTNPTITSFNYPIFNGISTFVLSGAAPMSLAPPAQSVAWGDDDAFSASFPAGSHPTVIAISEYGSGRVVAVGDTSFLANYYMNLYDNEKLALQIFAWLGHVCVKGIETVISLNAFNRETNKVPQILGADDVFSIQQNFDVYSGTERLYWVQNIVYVWKSPITGLVGMAGETEVWGYVGGLAPIDFSPGLGLITSVGRPSLIPKTLPATVTLCSTINNDVLVMKNDFWSHQFSVPAGCYISTEGASPEIVLVGWNSPYDANADFDSPTSGHVDTYVRLGESGPWLGGDNIIVPYGSASTAETSSGLHWIAQGDFAYNVDSDDQGFWFAPHYEGPSLEPPGVSVSSTGGRAYIISARCPANISICDSSGRHLGYNQNTGAMDEEIPWGILLQTNDTKLMIVYYCDNSYNLSLIGTGEGKVELEIGLMDEGGSVGILWNSSESVATGITIPYTITGTTVTPEFPSATILVVLMALAMLAVALTRKNRTRRFG